MPRVCSVAALLALFAPVASVAGQVSQFATSNPTESGFFGGAVAGVPDVNGDGRGDIVVGAPGEGPSNQNTFRGRVYIYSGATGALLRTLLSPNQQPNGLFGDAVAGIPDVNNDGRGDILVGAPGERVGVGPVGAGRAYIFSGATGLVLRVMKSPNEQANGAFGDAVAAVPDVNVDGRPDALIGAPDEDPGAAPDDSGRAYIYSGANGVLIRQFVSPSQEVDGNFGVSVGGLADVNGDSRGDVVIGADGEDPGLLTPTDCGRAYIMNGWTGARLRTLQSPGQETNGSFGESVAGIPDVNGDAAGDVVVGAPDENPGNSPADSGRAYIYSGATGQLLRKLASPSPEPSGNFGVAVAGMPDMNADGRGDVVVGAWNEDPATTPSNSGRVHIYSGASGLRLKTLGSLHPQVDGAFGIAVAGVPDVNANGRGDVVIGAPGENFGVTQIFSGRAYLFRN